MCLSEKLTFDLTVLKRCNFILKASTSVHDLLGTAPFVLIHVIRQPEQKTMIDKEVVSPTAE